MKRDTINTDNAIKGGERTLGTISSVCLITPPDCLETVTGDNTTDTDDYLEAILILQNGAFTQAASEAVYMCINTTTMSKKCKFATAVLTLQATKYM